MKKIRVLFEASPMVHGQKTGVGYYLGHLISALETSDYNIELTGYFFNFLHRKVEALPRLGNLKFKRLWLIPGKLLSFCRRFGFQPFLEIFTWKRADIVLFTNYVSLPLLNKRKTALIVYDLSFLDHPEFTQQRNLQFLQKFFPRSVQTADLIITISDFAKTRLEHYFPDLKARIVVTPIPPLAITQTKSPVTERLSTLGIAEGKYILHVGTIEPRKNLVNLVRAYSLLNTELQSQYSLVLAGGKGWKDEEILREAHEQRAKGLNIIMTGYIDEGEKAALYSNAACFVMPSHYEGFGMPILEAMQYGLPTTVSDIPVFHEVAGEAATYFDKNKPEDIATHLQSLLTDTALRQRLVEAGDKQLLTFSWEDNARRVLTAFEELLD